MFEESDLYKSRAHRAMRILARLEEEAAQKAIGDGVPRNVLELRTYPDDDREHLVDTRTGTTLWTSPKPEELLVWPEPEPRGGGLKG